MKAWLRTLELIFDAKGLTREERFLHTIHLLAKSALKIFEYSHPTSYPQLGDMLTQRFSDKHDRFHKFSQPVALRQGQWGLDAYMEQFLELQTQVPDMSPLDALDIYLWGLQPTVHIHLLGSQHVVTLERALEESRIFANAHRGHVVQASGRVDPFDDPMDLTFQAPLARYAESARPPMRSPSSSVRCINCGQTGHMRSACRALRRSPFVPSSMGF